MAGRPVVAVAGAASVDMTMRCPPAGWHDGDGIECYTPELIKTLDRPIEIGLGGNGAAAAYVMARLGVHVRLSAPVSGDELGRLTRQWLTDAGVELLSPPVASMMGAITAVDDHGNRTGCLQHPGPPIDWSAAGQCNDAAWMLFATHAQADQIDYDGVMSALNGARRDGRRTALDSGISWLRTIPQSAMHALWQYTDLVIGTSDELGAWAGCEDLESMAPCVLKHGPRDVIVKLGADGVAWSGGDQTLRHQPAYKVDRVDVTVGAGDGFNGGMLASLADGQSIESAVDAGQKIAAAIVSSGRGVLGWGQPQTTGTEAP